MAKFFAKFPIIRYNDTSCKNITARTKLSDEVSQTYSAFYNLPVRDGERADTVAFNSYTDPYYDWLLYYANGVVDPYYQWCLSDDSLQSSIVQKYGSNAEAQERIIFYRVRQSNDTIPSEAYSALTSGQKKYWHGVVDDVGTILYYERISNNNTARTNSLVVISKSLSDTNMGLLQTGERIFQTTSGRVTASAQVEWVNENQASLICIEGAFTVGNVTGASSGITAGVGGVQLLGYAIPLDELPYWEPVSYYDYEVEQNELYRNIRVLLPQVADVVVKRHSQLINE